MESGFVRRIPTPDEEQEKLSKPAAPYPEGYEEDVVLGVGTPLHLRPIRLDDGPELLKLFDLSLFHKVEDKMTFWWRVDGPLLHVKLSAPAAGWVAVGFNPSRGMQGANFIIGYVNDGRVLVSDEFGSSMVKHEPDERLGGTGPGHTVWK